MSNNHSATLAAGRIAVPDRAASGARPSFWRRLVDAWLRAYACRIDSNGNIMCEL